MTSKVIFYTQYANGKTKSMEDNLIDISWEENICVVLNKEEALAYARKISPWKNQFVINKTDDGKESKFKSFVFEGGVYKVICIFGDAQ